MKKIILKDFMFSILFLFIACFTVDTRASDGCLGQFKDCAEAYADLETLSRPTPNACQNCFHTCGIVETHYNRIKKEASIAF